MRVRNSNVDSCFEGTCVFEGRWTKVLLWHEGLLLHEVC